MYSSTGSAEDRQTKWYISPPPAAEDALQFFKEERVDGAIYNVYLKKIRYNTPADVEEAEDDRECRLQWTTISIHHIKSGTLDKLVEHLSSGGTGQGDLDSTYINVFLATYRTVASAKQVMNLVLERYKNVGEDPVMKQEIKEAHKKTLRVVISVWLDSYPNDFRDPPNYPTLKQLVEFAENHMSGSDLSNRAKTKLDKFIREQESPRAIAVEDIVFDFNWLEDIEIFAEAPLTRPAEFDTIPENIFAEQLTYMDAELFKKVVPHECMGSVWSRRDKKGRHAQSVFATVNQFNAVSYRVIATVLKNPSLPAEDRVEIIEKWILIAQELRVQKNFSALKAIISGLRSNPVYRLKPVWEIVEKRYWILFKELSEIFSGDNNNMMARELLMKEGTAKFADPESTNTIRGLTRSKSWNLSFSTWGRKKVNSMFEMQSTKVQGTVPYLGTFLTDLTMFDTAMPDNTEDGYINFEKKRKEFEILAQIKLLQSAAGLYNLKPDPVFMEWFHGIRTYDENESYELSCEIVPVGTDTPEVKGHRKKASLGFFTPKRSVTDPDEMSASTPTLFSDDSISDKSPSVTSQISAPPFQLRHSRSTNSLGSLDSRDLISTSPWKSPESMVVKVSLETSESHSTNLYKSILLTNSDHVRNVLRSVLLKYQVEDKTDDYVIFQNLPEREFQLPDRGNVFYAIDTSCDEIKFIVRRRSDLERMKNKRLKKKKTKLKYSI